MAKELIINSVESFEEALPLIQAAEKEFSTFTQEQVDTICEHAAMAVSKMRIPLAKMAHEETGYGIVVDKITKNQYASEHIWNYMRHAKTCGIIDENPAFGTKRVASPKGVIAAIVPEKEQDNYVEYISRFVGRENVYPMDIRAVGAAHIG